MSQLVKSKSQMGGTLVSAFYERSEEDNDNGEILSIAHAVEVTPEYQPLKPYSKEFRNRVDDISKRRQFKDEAFNGKNTIEDMYSKRVVQKIVLMLTIHTLSRRLMGTQVYSIRKPILKKLLIKSKIIK